MIINISNRPTTRFRKLVNKRQSSIQLFTKSKSFSIIEYKINRLKYPFYYYLIGTNIFIYICWKSNIISKQFLINNFTLNDYNKQRIYPFFSYSISHNSLVHLASSMIFLSVFGKQYELVYGGYQLFKLYRNGAIVGGLIQIFTTTHKQKPYKLYLGASASLSAVIAFFVLSNPYYKLQVLSIQLPCYVLGISFVSFDLASIMLTDKMAYQSHWGGMFTGLATFIYKHPRFIRMIRL